MHPRCWSGSVVRAAVLHTRPGDRSGSPPPIGTDARLLGQPPSCPQPIGAAGLSSRFVSGWFEGPRGEAGCALLMPRLPGRVGE